MIVISNKSIPHCKVMGPEEVENVEDIIIIDNVFPNMDEIVKKVRERNPEATIVVVGKLRDAISFGVDFAAQSLEDAIESVPALEKRRRWLSGLKDSEILFKELFENSTEIIIISDLEGNIINVNKTFEEVMGYTKGEIIGRNYREFLEPHVADEIFRKYNLVFKTKESLYGVKICSKKKDGEQIWLEGNISPIIKTGRVVAFQGNFRDVTGRERLETLLRKINKMNSTILREKEAESLLRTAFGKLFPNHQFNLFKEEGMIFITLSNTPLSIKKQECLKQFDWVRKVIPAGSHPSGCVYFEKHKDLNAYIFPIEILERKFGVVVLVDKTRYSEEELELINNALNDIAIAYVVLNVSADREKMINQLEINIEQFARLVDKIRNPLAVIAGLVDLEGAESIQEKVFIEIERIDEIIKEIERSWIRSEKLISGEKL